LPFDTDELAGRRLGLYEQRTEIGRSGKHLEGQLAGIPAPDPDLPGEEVSVAELLGEHRAARELVAEHQGWVREAAGTERNVETWTSRVADLETQIAAARQTLAEHQADLREARRQVQVKATALPDVEAIEKQLADAEDTNTAVRRAKQRTDLAARVETARAKYKDLTNEIETLDEQKSIAIGTAKMPIVGLAFDDQGVTYRSVPFKQCSAAEQLRVSLAMAMAMNPKIRVVRITDGSLLDSTNMALIEEMAAEHDFQVWIERVDESGSVGVVIEDGQVVEAGVQFAAEVVS